MSFEPEHVIVLDFYNRLEF